MRLTATTLRRIIKEETRRVLRESGFEPEPEPESDEWYDREEERAAEIEGYVDDELVRELIADCEDQILDIRGMGGDVHDIASAINHLEFELRDLGMSEREIKRRVERMNRRYLPLW